MKIDSRAASRTLAEIGNWRAVLLHGDDAGLIRERARACVRLVGGSTDDPFRVAILDADQHARIEEEAGALSLIGGRRAVWVREVQDSALAGVMAALSLDTDTLLVLEAPGLAARAKLRTTLEGHRSVAVIGCYPEEGRALAGSLSGLFRDASVSIDRDALTWLSSVLGADRGAVRQEVEKLILYAGEGGRLGLDDVQDCIGDSATATLDDATSAAMAGDRVSADTALERALAEGLSPIALARACLSLMTRLGKVMGWMDEGKSRQEALKQLRPPVFFRKAESFGKALERWDRETLARACEAVQGFERACKQTGSPDLALSRRLIAQLCLGPRSFRG
ncbi:DNA polymerase III subunit delta [Swaminathania salitolerans]|uniref:DNA-directed DNA polymerase n=1 Tax=Swaminathania salitolerans TaxID=182838 RepID=A0A511BRV1_9PROT|nr:DNA polymerase III subunit delta [Swaminathania salitolerans]GBQ14352.1 DNA polymerase III subunit delta [Swaminathania salitolerans LMG 21291]GEL03005.1 DNA polymerase III subunit delta [Swaminathania salitolerans]